jgi:hypothetical protein
MKKTNYLKIKVGDLLADKENQKILKELLWVKPKAKKEQEVQELINSCDTKIKRPRFE